MKIAVCVPHYRDPKAGFALCLANMTAASKHDLKVFFREGPRVIENRNLLVSDARRWGADAVLFLDDDMLFPETSLDRLAAHEKEVVACNYALRGKPTAPAAASGGPGAYKRIWITKEEAEAGDLQRIAFSGLGMTFVSMAAIARISGSVFQPPLDVYGEAACGNDVHFFAQLERAGAEIWMDPSLSWELAHIWETQLTLADAIAQRASWWEQQRGGGPVYLGSLLPGSRNK